MNKSKFDEDKGKVIIVGGGIAAIIETADEATDGNTQVNTLRQCNNNNTIYSLACI